MTQLEAVGLDPSKLRTKLKRKSSQEAHQDGVAVVAVDELEADDGLAGVFIGQPG